MQKSKIQWTETTWNCVLGCSKISPGCKFCYAIRQVHRMAGNPNPKIAAANSGLTVIQNGVPNWTGKVRLIEDRLLEPLRWRRPRMIFVNSLSDLWHESLSLLDIAKVYAVMALCETQNLGHVFQILTKRPENRHDAFAGPGTDFWDLVEGEMERICGEHGWCCGGLPDLPLRNVWEGASVEDQETSDRRIPLLLKTPAAVRFVSAEPLLGPVNIRGFLMEGIDPGLCGNCGKGHGFTRCPNTGGIAKTRESDCSEFKRINFTLSWVIVGGESGPGARPFQIEWARSIIEQCGAAGVPAFMKQAGAVPIIRDYTIEELRSKQNPEREWPEGTHFGNCTGIQEFNGRQVLLHDKKGGDMSEWPERMRVRQMPAVKGVS